MKVYIVRYDDESEDPPIKHVFAKEEDAARVVDSHKKYQANGKPYHNSWSYRAYEVE